MPETSKIKNFVEIFQYLSLFIVLVGLFLGTIYAFDGNLFLSLPVSFGLVIVLYYFIDLMIAARMQAKKGGLKLGIQALWIIYILSAIPTSFFILHMLNVEFFEKNAIMENGKQKVECLGNIKSQYTQSYENYLSTKRANLNSDMTLYAAGGMTAQEVANRNNVSESLVSSLDLSNLATSIDESYINYARIKFVEQDTLIFGNTETFLNKHDNIIKNWQRFSINTSFLELDKYIPKTYQTLNDFLEKEKAVKLPALALHCTQACLINKPIDLAKKHIGVGSMLIILLVNGLLLLPFFLSPKKIYISESKNKNTGGPTVHS